ncbi:hypothetical protein EDEG_01027 [Edhazardia aedis USNM 41457]|uniref:Uncharacterized protein n=1 Tax=Edhazardia aedis (strain USNM 41457) TaxID=1003232 RepID=J9DQG6_EDHAE|nr:hypothetical protein EDEG_01027 [Edhazardia aedis USNM 41457]|eukprot:EJW04805.1 hypothetical protein EDEG_01027 [Edhazardia aedis USNM 41457]
MYVVFFATIHCKFFHYARLYLWRNMCGGELILFNMQNLRIKTDKIEIFALYLHLRKSDCEKQLNLLIHEVNLFLITFISDTLQLFIDSKYHLCFFSRGLH